MADTIYLRYEESAKPILTNRDGEAIVNWVDGGTASVTADATHAHAGTKSFKLVGTDVGDFTTNYISLASGNNATFTAGRKYDIGIWTYTTDNASIKIKTGGVTSSSILCTADAWGYKHFTFTAVTATTALQIITVDAGTVWFELQPFTEAVDLTVLSERGMSDPDSFDFFPALQKTFLDGSMKDYIKGFRRKILVDVGVVASSADRKQILYWMIDNDRTVDYLTEVNVSLALEDVSGFSNEWKYDCSLNRYFVFALQEPSIRTTFPV